MRTRSSSSEGMDTASAAAGPAPGRGSTTASDVTNTDPSREAETMMPVFWHTRNSVIPSVCKSSSLIGVDEYLRGQLQC
jgi:hypothetical protein